MAALNLPTVKVAAAHIAPVWLDAAATLRLTLDAIAEASSHNASLVVFAESHLPGFPYFAGVAAPIDNHDLFARFVANSVHVDGPEIRAVRDAAAKHEIAVSLGFSETAGPERSAACLWNSNVLIGPDGALLNHHRKICATWYEK